MIATDGKQTIANAPAREREPWRVLDDSLLSRTTAGINVRIFHVSGEVILEVSCADANAVATIPPNEVLHAFEHPMIYLDDPSPFA